MALKVRAQLVESLERLSLPVVSCIATANSRAAQEQAAAAAATAPGATAPIAGLGDAPGSTGDSLFGAAFSRLAQLQGSEAAQTGAHESSALSRSIRALGFTSPGSISSALLSQQKPLDNLKKCLITGLFDKVAIRLTDGSYQTVVDSQNVSIHPSSIIIQVSLAARCRVAIFPLMHAYLFSSDSSSLNRLFFTLDSTRNRTARRRRPRKPTRTRACTPRSQPATAHARRVSAFLPRRARPAISVSPAATRLAAGRALLAPRLAAAVAAAAATIRSGA
jgi:hypothetical protein